MKFRLSLGLCLVLLTGLLGADPASPVFLVVDPDWEPYERIDDTGAHVGIAADLVRLIAERSGVELTLLRTKDWDESVQASKDGRAQVVSFLNQTAKRDEWLLFTDPYFVDPTVFITREEHEFIADPARLSDQTIVFPSGTSLEEQVRQMYPNLKVVIVPTETDALSMVSQKNADMTLRSLTMAAYTIRKGGWFNLKIAGQVPALDNKFRIGVVKTEPRLRDRLNAGVATITPQEVQLAVNRHIAIQVYQGVDWVLLLSVVAVFLVILSLGLLWITQLRSLNTQLAARDAEKALILREVHHRLKNNMGTVGGLLSLQAMTLKDPQAVEALEDAQGRVHSMMVLYDQLYQSQDQQSISLSTYLPPLVTRIISHFANRDLVTVECRVADLVLAAQQVQYLGILVNELLTNAMKYAFVGRSRGLITISLTVEGKRATLVVEDDGRGVPESVDFENSTGFGMSLVQSMARSLKGTLRIERGAGTRIILEFL